MKKFKKFQLVLEMDDVFFSYLTIAADTLKTSLPNFIKKAVQTLIYLLDQLEHNPGHEVAIVDEKGKVVKTLVLP